jgi:hypothetical protein
VVIWGWGCLVDSSRKKKKKKEEKEWQLSESAESAL